MTDEQEKEFSQEKEEKENKQESLEKINNRSNNIEELKKSLEEANDRYIRLYADFENFKKLEARNKKELLKYANEDIMTDILTVIDHLELALQHSSGNETSNSLAEGVELTLKELKSVLEKYGLITIDALGKPFDPSVHHAMSQIESEDAEENTVIKEFRKGYMLRDRVIRAALVAVAKKQTRPERIEKDNSNDQNLMADKN